jgi:hypothetical protein
VAVSQSGNRLAYFKVSDTTTFTNTALVDLHVAGTDLTTPCTLLQTPTAFGPGSVFSAAGAAMVWVGVTVAGQAVMVTGSYADMGTCTSHKRDAPVHDDADGHRRRRAVAASGGNPPLAASRGAAHAARQSGDLPRGL